MQMQMNTPESLVFRSGPSFLLEDAQASNQIWIPQKSGANAMEPDMLGEMHKKTQHAGQNTTFKAEEMAKKYTRKNGNTA